jgi:hypothetical protein
VGHGVVNGDSPRRDYRVGPLIRPHEWVEPGSETASTRIHNLFLLIVEVEVEVGGGGGGDRGGGGGRGGQGLASWS